MRKNNLYAPPIDRTLSSRPSHWQEYLALLEQKKVPQKTRRWHVASVEAFLKELEPDSVRQVRTSRTASPGRVVCVRNNCLKPTVVVAKQSNADYPMVRCRFWCGVIKPVKRLTSCLNEPMPSTSPRIVTFLSRRQSSGYRESQVFPVGGSGTKRTACLPRPRRRRSGRGAAA